MGLLAACHKRGVSVPDNLSIIGFDDVDMATYTLPPLTTIRQPRFELGQRAMQMMLDLLADQKPENQIVPGELVVRQTTARLWPGEHPAGNRVNIDFFCITAQSIALLYFGRGGSNMKLGFHGATTMTANLQTDVAASAHAGF